MNSSALYCNRDFCMKGRIGVFQGLHWCGCKGKVEERSSHSLLLFNNVIFLLCFRLVSHSALMSLLTSNKTLRHRKLLFSVSGWIVAILYDSVAPRGPLFYVTSFTYLSYFTWRLYLHCHPLALFVCVCICDYHFFPFYLLIGSQGFFFALVVFQTLVDTATHG